MTDQIIVDVEGLGELEFPDGTDPAVIQATVKRLLSARAPETMRPMASHGDEPDEPAARGSSRLATAGGMIGSLAGGSRGTLAGMLLAGAGGAAGQAATELVAGSREPYQASAGGGFVPRMPIPSMPSGALSRVARAGGEQATAELAGRGIMGGLTKGARRLYTGLMKPSKALRREHPDLTETLLKERATISKPGLAKVERRLDESVDEADAIINTASPHTAPVRANEIIPEFADTVKNLRKRVDIGQPSQLPEVGRRGRALMRADNQIGFDLTRAQALKRTAQDASNAGYRQAERGGVKEVSADTMLDKDVARGLRKAIEQRVPAVAAVNRRSQSLGGGKRGLEDALGREGNTSLIGMRDLIGAGAGGALGGPGGAAGGAAIMRLLAQPRTGSAVAIGANELSRIPYSQLLRMLEQALQEQE